MPFLKSFAHSPKKVNGKTVYFCHGCGKPLRRSDLYAGRTEHWRPPDNPCLRESIRKGEIRMAREEGIPVAEWRARRINREK